MKLLGVSASLRNARYGAGSDRLIEEISSITDHARLREFLSEQTKIRVEDFLAAGRAQGLPFDALYRNLRKARGDRGLSNSEAALVAGLWGARCEGAEIGHIGLSRHFPMNGAPVDLNGLRRRILASDAILLSGPVYFGDRGSPAQAFFEFLHDDPASAHHVRDRLFGGIAVGAKRNGGQETTLIYQLVDATNLNMLAVGNDNETTSQYGGTAHAGDIGTLWKDEYGIGTAIGTGRRIGRIGRILDRAAGRVPSDRVKIAVWMLQDDAAHRGLKLARDFAREIQIADPRVRVDILNFTEDEIERCIACDVCPIDVGPPEEYRCIIKSERDAMVRHHHRLIDVDAILLGAYSPVDRRQIRSVYQRFIERTRYLRRDDYILGDRLVAPFVVSEVNSNQNLHIRMLTSLVRHHSVLHHPLIGVEFEGRVLNWGNLLEQGKRFAANAVRLTAGRLLSEADDVIRTAYNPVGYEVSAEKLRQDVAAGRVETVVAHRGTEHAVAKRRRLS